MTKLAAVLLGVMLIASSLGSTSVMAQDDGQVERPDGWDETSHSDATDPDYDVVFPQDAVNTITIKIDPAEWQAMQDDMTDLYGEFGTNDSMGSPGGGEMPQGGDRPEGAPQSGEMPQQPDGAGDPGGMGNAGMGAISSSDEDPIWVPVDVTFNGEIWTNVGMRFKGNSSLSGAWRSGSIKLPFKLDFDQFEDDYLEIDNQRFYGFKQISFSSNWGDESMLHEKVASDLFRESGIAAANTAFYAVYVDYGEGLVYFGLYTAVEVVDDTVIETQFSDDSGNLYKPERTGAAFVDGTFDEATFDKKTNEDEADYSDILALFEALHADTRLTDSETWRTNLESVFNVDEFVHWLAVNTVIQNWDTYGRMAHNYYLYNDPATGQLTWIPWDNNEALSSDRMGGGRGGAGEASGTSSLDLASLGDDWPLIRYLLDDPLYHALYVGYVEDTIENAFDPATMETTYQTLHDLIALYVAEDSSVSDEAFEASLDTLIAHVNTRYAVAQEYVASQPAD
ncbi:CotH kinase family protein [Aggregatilinea lenta]|uniref:CotH kinase family protein n=1 Tax=Aggregatilinea lenta TaxID=913108 RepID=UPI001EE82F91|nr:CotH kinase family protein [Aggregatilinea lenta]